jgi:protoheme ferro-lyase
MYQKYSYLKCNLKARVTRVINSNCQNLIALPQYDFFSICSVTSVRALH